MIYPEFIDTYITCHGEEDTIAVSLDNVDVEALNMAIKALEKESRADFEELKRRIIMEVDGGTDDAWLAYGEVCDRISNTIDKFVADMRGEEE